MKEYLISIESTIKDALKQLDKAASKTLFVVDPENVLLGSVSDGDIRRAILSGRDINKGISSIMNKNPTYVSNNYVIRDVKKVMLKNKFEAIPVLMGDKKIIKILLWNNIFNEKKMQYKQLDLPVVIMAGGKGKRLDPFTRILPKPLIPINNKPIIEIIMDEFAKFGMKNFYISINHKAKIIRAYFEEHNSDYNFKYITEDSPLGTAGALKLIENKLRSPFFVSNCDIIIKDDYTKIYDFHRESKYALTMVGSMQHYTIPYGVCYIDNGGLLKSIEEKPEYNLLVNTGMYLLDPHVLRFIPKNKLFNMTDLIIKLKNNNLKIGVLPTSQNSWIDVGRWSEFEKIISS